MEYFRSVRPSVALQLAGWRQKAQAIPDPVLREQALSSLTSKQFHCEGGGVFAAPSRDPLGYLMRFLVPYQTLCDYLDTVTDRGPSLDRADFRLLHQSLLDAVTPRAALKDYYQRHPYTQDGGYLADLVTACQQLLPAFPGYSRVAAQVRHLAQLYIDLQVLKHGPVSERVSGLQAWYAGAGGPETGLNWWEFAAATGSTLPIFSLMQAALEPIADPARIRRLHAIYFPWMGSLHILLDYFIDQAEDLAHGDLNFVSYYPNLDEAAQSIRNIYQTTLSLIGDDEDAAFHRYVARGLLGFYLSDRKVRNSLTRPACSLLTAGGPISVGVWLAARVGRAP
ncbi:MAG: tetraprenyl-beta-curcumene synthase family protein [Thermaerobacter sp.]|nr:tetraprenyl-beta-curcumene synthase family protein [Thermaerobacter sp.]